MNRRRAFAELLLGVLAAAGAVAAWFGAATPVTVAPVLPGEPSTSSYTYYAPMLTLSLLLTTLAGVLAVVGIARLRRTSTTPPATGDHGL